jgi:serine/threonine protein kinase
MMLTSRAKLGPYETLSPLGAGGMGEVYRARDTRLGRDVAPKVLPAGVADDRSRRARFEQKARKYRSDLWMLENFSSRRGWLWKW